MIILNEEYVLIPDTLDPSGKFHALMHAPCKDKKITEFGEWSGYYNSFPDPYMTIEGGYQVYKCNVCAKELPDDIFNKVKFLFP